MAAPKTPDRRRIPPVRDITPESFARGIVDAVNKYLKDHGEPPLKREADAASDDDPKPV